MTHAGCLSCAEASAQKEAREGAAARVAILAVTILTALHVHSLADKSAHMMKTLIAAAWRVSYLTQHHAAVGWLALKTLKGLQTLGQAWLVQVVQLAEACISQEGMLGAVKGCCQAAKVRELLPALKSLSYLFSSGKVAMLSLPL